MGGSQNSEATTPLSQHLCQGYSKDNGNLILAPSFKFSVLIFRQFSFVEKRNEAMSTAPHFHFSLPPRAHRAFLRCEIPSINRPWQRSGPFSFVLSHLLAGKLEAWRANEMILYSSISRSRGQSLMPLPTTTMPFP